MTQDEAGDKFVAALAKIMGESERIPKNGQIRSLGGGPSYSFARDPDILNVVVPRLAEAGIILIPETTDIIENSPSMSGKQMVVTIKTGWLVTNGIASLRFQTFGMGADSGDKGLPKAQTNARKYALLMLLHLATGDDPDEHASSEARPRPAERPPKPPTGPTEGELKDQIAQFAGAHNIGLDAITRAADAVGVAKGGRATIEQLEAILSRLSGSQGTVLMDKVLAVTGGEEVIDSGL